MKFRYIKSILSAASLLLAVSVTSCIGDLDADSYRPEYSDDIRPGKRF